jgi:hypothetical protein
VEVGVRWLAGGVQDVLSAGSRGGGIWVINKKLAVGQMKRMVEKGC